MSPRSMPAANGDGDGYMLVLFGQPIKVHRMLSNADNIRVKGQSGILGSNCPENTQNVKTPIYYNGLGPLEPPLRIDQK